MPSMNDLEWIDSRIRERVSKLRELHISARNPELPSIDAGKFGQQVADLAKTLCHKVEREGHNRFTESSPSIDISMILRQLMWTYNLIRWINADDTRFGNVGYDVLITEVVMEGLSGIDAAIEIRTVLPNCKVLLLSGNLGTADMLKDAHERGQDFDILAKPVHPSVIIGRLKAMSVLN